LLNLMFLTPMTFDEGLTLFLILYLLGVFGLLVYWEWSYAIHRFLRKLTKKESQDGQTR